MFSKVSSLKLRDDILESHAIHIYVAYIMLGNQAIRLKSSVKLEAGSLSMMEIN